MRLNSPPDLRQVGTKKSGSINVGSCSSFKFKTLFSISSYLASGDGDGKVSIWDWKTTRMLARWKAHDRTCIQALWHPHETSKLATASWDGTIKYWD